MSAASQLPLSNIWQNNCWTLAANTALVYDYVLTFSKEVEYIWIKPWSWVSSLYIIVRYIGLVNFIVPNFIGSSFLPGPAKANGYLNSCQIIGIAYAWTYILFFGAADAMMILRIWAMHNRSKQILFILLTFFLLEIVFCTISAAVYSDPANVPTVTIQLGQFTICNTQVTSMIWMQVGTAFQLSYNTIVCVLAVSKFMRQSLHMYRATKRWQPNRYLNLFVKQGILYFVAFFVFTVVNLLGLSEQLAMGGAQEIVLPLTQVAVYTLTPRFIISVRELVSRDVRIVSEGNTSAEFVRWTPSLSDQDVGVPTIAFAHAEEAGEGKEAFELEEVARGVEV